VGGRLGRRNVPTIVNRGYGAAFAWDGREASLEGQVLRPLSSPNELGTNPAAVVRRLSQSRTYRSDFRSTFGRDVNEEDLGRALASYVRSVVSGGSSVDRYRDPGALSAEATLGLRVFVGKGNCWMCHSGPMFTDEKFHNTGIAWDGQRYLDEGRAIVTAKATDRGAFKTPTLREVARTAPYMHDGSLQRLEDVIDFYSRGGRPNQHLDVAIEPLQLTVQEKHGLVAFLRALSGTIRR
jgi:cytochrome c peroxidase